MVAACVDWNETEIVLTVYIEGAASEEERDILSIAEAEIMGDFLPAREVYVRIVEGAKPPFKTVGVWVFLRHGYRVTE